MRQLLHFSLLYWLTTFFHQVGEFEWSEKTQGIILSAFYYGYIVTHVPGGLLAQRFGGKHTLGLGILSTAILTLLTPLAAKQGAVVLSIVRFLEGLGEVNQRILMPYKNNSTASCSTTKLLFQGVTFPALCTMLAQWAPPHERSTLSTAAFTGKTNIFEIMHKFY